MRQIASRITGRAWPRAVLVLAVFAACGRAEETRSALETQEERAFKQAAAIADPSIVRIETVGGLDLVGKVLTGTGPTTGVVVSPDGYIITSSFNFASKPASILVTLPDGRRFPAEQVATDSARMLTLIKIDVQGERTELTPITAAKRDEIRVGQWSIALGRTYDLKFPNISVGIVSAVNRIWGRAIQTDAKTSPANYGGPLVDLSGRAIGVLVPLSPQKSGQTAGVEWYDGGIGFAIPMEDIYRHLEQMKQGKDLKPGLMGIGFEDQGVLAGEAKITRVRPESPADKAGLQVGDLIVEADGQPIHRVPDLRHILGRKYAGESVQIAFRRGEEQTPRNVTIELVDKLVPYESGYIGILPVRTAIGEEASGVTVREVLADTPASQAGLQRHDRITKINDEPISTVGQLSDVVGRILPGESIRLSVQRGEKSLSLELTLAGKPTTIPEQLSTTAVPSPKTKPEEKLGRLTGTLPGNDTAAYWAYVPDQYNPAYEYTLVVWLHPAGDTMEADLHKAWQEHCNRRGIILLAPKAEDLSGWKANEAEIVKQIIDQFREQYSIAPSRVVLLGYAEGGEFAWKIGFKYRELIRGLALVSAPLRSAPPDNDPDYPVQIFLASRANDPLERVAKQVVQVLQKMKFPVWWESFPKTEGENIPEELTEKIVRWVDALDRI